MYSTAVRLLLNAIIPSHPAQNKVALITIKPPGALMMIMMVLMVTMLTMIMTRMKFVVMRVRMATKKSTGAERMPLVDENNVFV